jgi:PHD finger-like domain-containing protein 5A
MSKHHADLIKCRKTTGQAIGKVCEFCQDKCVNCDSYVQLYTKARICVECNYGFFGERCIICNAKGITDAYYCYKCTLLEKNRDGCPKIINVGTSKTDRYYDQKKFHVFKENEEV